MSTLYSQLSISDLESELLRLQTAGQQAFDEARWSEYEVLMTKWYLVKSYQILPTVDIKIGRTYRLAEEYDRITVAYLDGIMAWGTRESTAAEDAVPIARLEEVD